MHTKVIIPDWISCRTYNFQKSESRTFISNERNHEYILLEDVSSDLWHIIETSNTYQEIEDWAIKHKVLDSLDDFLNELSSQNLIIFDEMPKDNSNYNCIDEQTDSEEEATLEIINEMKNWCYSHGFLYSLFIELTYDCNLRCIHCYNPKNMNGIQISFKQLKNIIDEAILLGCFHITFSGGESTLDKDFMEILQYARKRRLSVEIFTNGQTLYDNPLFMEILLSLYIYRIGLSIYSMNEVIHDKITGVKGSCGKTINIVKKLRNQNVNVEIKCFQMNCNNTEYLKVVEFARKNHASIGVDLSLIPTISGDKKTLALELKDEDKLINLYTDKNSPLYIGNLDKYGKKECKYDSNPCYAGFSVLSLSPNLDIFPCCSLPLKLGNLNETQLENIWKNAIGEDPGNILYQWQSIELKDLKECFREDYCSFCNYCPGMGFLENGYLKKSDILCRQARAKQKAAEILKYHSMEG
ncbi:MAG: radical SAM protein [Prevotella sp.]|jgi:MoaA/NifB/PqqE/SkfB family radical SAM enzyme|nr:radical SAM protein [Prevotella sp.]